MDQVKFLHARIFPQEIFESFIDELSDDAAALKACSLTCQSWIHPAQSYIHQSIQISLNSNLDLEKYGSPQLARHVRQLCIVSDASGTFLGIDALKPHDDLWRFTLRFTRLTSLSLINQKWSIVPPDVKEHLLCPNLTSITVRGLLLSEEDAYPLFSYLSTSSTLRTLTIGLIFFKVDSNSPCNLLRNVAPSARLEKLDLQFRFWHNTVAVSMASWLRAMASHGCVEQLWLSSGLDLGGEGVLQSLISAIGAAEVDLRIAALGYFDPWADTGIQGCVNLRSITFKVQNRRGSPRFDQYIDQILRQTASRSLTNIGLEFHQDALNLGNPVFLLALDEILSTPPFDRLPEVKFIFPCGRESDEPKVDMYFRQWFPLIFSEKKISYSYPSYPINDV